MKTIKIFTIHLLLSIFTSAYAGSYALDKFYEKTHTFSATFEQKVKTLDDKSIQTSKGHILISRPNKFVMVYSEPDQQQYVSNGKVLWIYDKDLEQVTIKKFDKEMRSSPVLVLSGKNELRELYNIEESSDYGKPEQDIFVLKPKIVSGEEATTQFSRVELVFVFEKLQELRMWDHFNHITILSLNDQKLNEAVPDSTFNFIIPDNIDVLDNTIQ
ncbi:MAG: outer membrane lipoprotein chaperone LolA [Gammaproteobacteria bacterium]|nr:outer membrane lipoprotein chaperone LolA [Gammaproteobacteria bacterium]